MLKVAKFGGSSMADAGQYQKIRDIIRSDPSRRVVVVSAAGKRSAGDNKITDLLYLCYAHLQYGVSCDGIYQMIRERYGDIHRELGLRVDLEGVLDRLRSQMEQGISRDELVSRGEYLSALLMADYLGFTFVDAAQWLFFHYDGTIDQEKSYAALRALARDKCVVIPGFYGLMPDGKLRTLTRGGSDITGALAAAALDADVYENWTDVSGILMADPRIVDHPRSIERAAVEAAAQGDDVAVFRALVFGGPFAGGLDGAFVGFRAGVREKDPLQAGSFAEHLCELRGRFGVVEIGDMLEAAELRRNGIAPFVVVHAEDIHADAAAEVDVLPPVRAAEERALAADDLQRKTVIGVGKILLIECLRKHN